MSEPVLPRFPVRTAAANGPPKYSDEQMQAIQRLERKIGKMNAWKAVKRGALIGLISAAIGVGYKESAVDAWLMSKTAQKEVASVLMATHDSRGYWERFTGRGKKPAQITVGERVFTVRGPDGSPLHIGRDKILGGVPKYFKTTPNIPLSMSSAKTSGLGAAAGAAAGLGAGVWLSRRRKNMIEGIKTGRVPPSAADSAWKKGANRARQMFKRRGR
ncbi:Uncharacterised protein [uncultured archaeon]|nr:Uncharacterised protein [uncultured archaeon]